MSNEGLQPGMDVYYSYPGSPGKKIWRGTVISREEAMAERGLTLEQALAHESRFREDTWVRITHNFTTTEDHWHTVSWHTIAPVGRVDTCHGDHVALIPPMVMLAESAE